MTTELPSWHNRGGRSRVIPKGITGVLNAQLDEALVARRQARLRKGIEKVMYNGSALTGEWSNEAYKMYNWEPAFVEKQAALFGQSGRFSSAGQARGVGASETRVPVFTTWVGEKGQTPGELEDNAQFVGIVTYAGRDTGDKGATLMGGGVYTAINPGPTAWVIGDYLQWGVPSDAEIKSMRAWAGDMANVLDKGGRVTSIIKPFHISQTDFMDARRVTEAIDMAYKIEAAVYVPRDKMVSTERNEPVDVFSIQGNFARAVRDLIEANVQIAWMMEQIQTAGPGVVADTEASRNKRRTALIILLKQLAANASQQALEEDAVFTPDVLAKLDNKDIGNMLNKESPWQRMVRGLASVKQVVERKVIGRAVYGAPVGNDADVHLRAYAY